MTKMADGTVINGMISGVEASASDYITRDPFVRVGTIIGTHKPDTTIKDNYKRYDIVIEKYTNPNGVVTTLSLDRVRVCSLFGGVADYVRWTPRELANAADGFQDQDKDNGSRVLVIGLDGDLAYNPLIIGGLPHPNQKIDDETFNFAFEFNGINIAIDKDGQLTLTRKGATKTDGTVDGDNDTKGGQTVIFDKEGSITIKSSKDNSVTFNDKDDTIDIKTNKNLNITSGDKVNIDSKGVLAGASGAKDAFVMGTTYRKAENSLNQTVQTELTKLLTYTTMAAVGVQGAAAAHKVPITGPMAGSALLDAAAQALVQMVSSISSLMQAYVQFEAKQKTFLSDKNFTD